jgi:hypothetical protein
VCLVQELEAAQQLLQQQKEVLAGLHAEEKAADSGFRRQYAHLDATPHLTALYKARLAHASGSAGGGTPPLPEATSGRLRAAADKAHAPRSSAVGAQQAAQTPRNASKALAHLPAAGAAASTVQSPAATTKAAPGATATPGSAGLFHGHQHVPVIAAGGQGQSSCKPEERVPLLGPPGMVAVQLHDSQRPDGIDAAAWARFTELHAARAQLELATRQQAAKVRRHTPAPAMHECHCLLLHLGARQVAHTLCTLGAATALLVCCRCCA